MSPKLPLAVDARTCARARGLRRILLVLPALVVMVGCPCQDNWRSTRAMVPLVCDPGASLSFEKHGDDEWAVCRCHISLVQRLDAGAP